MELSKDYNDLPELPEAEFNNPTDWLEGLFTNCSNCGKSCDNGFKFKNCVICEKCVRNIVEDNLPIT